MTSELAEWKRLAERELTFVDNTESHVFAGYVLTLIAQVEEIQAKLQDPTAVHLNMLRGDIAKPSVDLIRHLYPEIDEQLTALTAQVERVTRERDDYRECYEDARRVARAIGVAMHGIGAAASPSLCDLVGPASRLRQRAEAAEAENTKLKWDRGAVLKLLDEVLCDVKGAGTWEAVDHYPSLAYRRAMDRLRAAMENGEMELITMSLYDYFQRTARAALTPPPAQEDR
jgi:hypothetical protein